MVGLAKRADFNRHESIHRVNGYAADAYTYYPVVIIGAGVSGICMGTQLKEKLGFDQFRIFDRQAGIGGTWWINRYPGVAVDIPAALYSFSFCPNPKWSSLYPSGPEIVQYLQSVCEKYEITDKIQTDTELQGARWLETEQMWEVKLRHLVPGTGDLSDKDRRKIVESEGERAVYTSTETIRTRIFVSAVGGLVQPNEVPKDVPGFENFKGEVFHTARWRSDIDFTDKDVVVIGSGCSAAQAVPRLPLSPFNARRVTQVMRSPPWVVPKHRAPGGNENFDKWAPPFFTYVPGALKILRFYMFLRAEYDWMLFGNEDRHAKFRLKNEAKLVEHMKKNVPEEYHDMLRPNFGLGCKRRIFDAEWLPGLGSSKVELTTQPLTRVNEQSVTVGPGRGYSYSNNPNSKAPTEEREIPADIIVLANGFDTTSWYHPLSIKGRHGADLHEVMESRGGAQAYLGEAMDGFPNFFIIFGPNTATGHSSVYLATENMVQYSLNFIKPILNGDATLVEVKKEAEIKYTQNIQKQLQSTVWHRGGCHSWYLRKDGWNATVYPYSQFVAIFQYTFPRWSDWDITYTWKGLAKLWTKRIFNLAMIYAIFTIWLKARQMGLSLSPANMKVLGRYGAIFLLGKVQKKARDTRMALLSSD